MQAALRPNARELRVFYASPVGIGISLND